MKKIIYIFSITFLVLGCASDDSSDDYNPDDVDGDGVTNQQEVVDNTSPDNPCDFRQASQYYPSVSQSWKSLDCDGDGVTNWNELDPDGNGTVQNNGTNPIIGCDFNTEDRTLEPSSVWNSGDCDRDGVINSQEEIDNTDLNNYCDFIVTHITEELPNWWLEEDCDEDGRNNGNELSNNTDPTDPTDFIGSGDMLTEIINLANGYRHIFTENGTRYDSVVQQDNTTIASFEYDPLNNLTSVFLNIDNTTITFTYQDDQITQIIRTEGSEVNVIDVVYDNNIIYTYDSESPLGLYKGKYTFNSLNKITSEESFFYSSGHLTHSLETFEYENGEIVASNQENQGYDQINDVYYDLSEFGLNSSSGQTISYLESTINPIFNATQNIYINYILMPEILSRCWTSGPGAFSYYYRNCITYHWEFDYYSGGGTNCNGVYNSQANGLPVYGYFSNLDAHFDYEFYYE